MPLLPSSGKVIFEVCCHLVSQRKALQEWALVTTGLLSLSVHCQLVYLSSPIFPIWLYLGLPPIQTCTQVLVSPSAFRKTWTQLCYPKANRKTQRKTGGGLFQENLLDMPRDSEKAKQSRRCCWASSVWPEVNQVWRCPHRARDQGTPSQCFSAKSTCHSGMLTYSGFHLNTTSTKKSLPQQIAHL